MKHNVCDYMPAKAVQGRWRVFLGGNDMNEVLRIGKAASEMHITVQGYKVTLCFADKANPEVAAFVKQALLGVYSMSTK